MSSTFNANPLNCSFLHQCVDVHFRLLRSCLLGVYPLFRRAAADLQGAALRVHISLTPGGLPAPQDDPAESDSQEEETLVEEPAPPAPPPTSPPPQTTQSQTAQDVTLSSQPAEILSDDQSFPVTLAVHRAKNLTLKGQHVKPS